jgi:hypothetical protein
LLAAVTVVAFSLLTGASALGAILPEGLRPAPDHDAG